MTDEELAALYLRQYPQIADLLNQVGEVEPEE